MFDVQYPYITYGLMAITILLSYFANQDASFKRRMIFYPYDIKRRNEYYRFLTGGLIHADWMHLGVNMFVLYMFGAKAEFAFLSVFGAFGWFLYPAMYLLSIPIAETYSYVKHHDNPMYMSLGASGAVSAVVFASILFSPLDKMGLLLIPVMIPGFIMGILYLLYSNLMARRAQDNIGHNAHFYGALFGLLFPVMFKPALFLYFIYQIQSWISNL